MGTRTDTYGDQVTEYKDGARMPISGTRFDSSRNEIARKLDVDLPWLKPWEIVADTFYCVLYTSCDRI